MKIVYMTLVGPGDPTRASIPLHLAVNGSVEVGHDVTVTLAGDAVELLVGDAAEKVEGVGVPPMRELLAKAREHDVTFFV